MPFKHLITYTQSLLVHSIYHKYCPPSLYNTWITNSMRNDARDLRNADTLYVPYARTEHVKKCHISPCLEYGMNFLYKSSPQTLPHLK